jgi:hypothetical protein
MFHPIRAQYPETFLSYGEDLCRTSTDTINILQASSALFVLFTYLQVWRAFGIQRHIAANSIKTRDDQYDTSIEHRGVSGLLWVYSGHACCRWTASTTAGCMSFSVGHQVHLPRGGPYAL